jgi:hypothetical protein
LRKDWDERLEDDKLILERILILVRNVLQVPTNVRAEQRADGERQNPESILHANSRVINGVIRFFAFHFFARHWSLIAPFKKNGDRLTFDRGHLLSYRVADLRILIRLFTNMQILLSVPL